ncbi:MAG: polysaccharide biosynthesis tyrosine autokinase [Bacteroidales bacterium]|nr:polysaccharide biosynthesis tyrosine autokinase [Bacteroidales bacterium]
MNQHTNNQPPPTGPGYPESNYGYPSHPYPKEEKPINWKKHLFLFLSNWYWFFITLGVALGIAFFKIRYTIPQYQATATLIIEEGQASNDILGELRAVRYWRRQADMANEVAKLSSFSITKRTVDSLDQEIFWTAHGRIRERPLYDNPRFKLHILNDSANWYKNQKWFIDYIDEITFRLYQENVLDTLLMYDQELNIQGWNFSITRIPEMSGYNTYHFVVNDPVTLAKYYKNKLQVETADKEGTIITIRSEGPVGEREVDFLNTISKTYILSGLERKQEIAENTFIFIDEQIDIILDSLTQAEDQLLTFRLSNNVINLSREGEMAYEKLKSFHEQKTKLKLKENYYSYLQSYVEERNDPKTLISPTLADANDQVLIGAVQELQKLYETRENLDYTVQQDNPGLESINERISAARMRILEVIKGLIYNNVLIMDQITTEERSVLDQLKTLPLNEQQLLNIKRKYDLYNQFYTYLLQKRAEAGIQKASTISNIRSIDLARYDQVIQVGNNKMLILLIAIMLGLLLPAVIFFLWDLLDTRIREREDITDNSSIPLIGIVGHAPGPGDLPIKDAPNSSFAESLRRIRTNLQFILRDPEQKVIMVTSSVSGEGKTFIAANLAAIFAMNNKRVLLVGCDLRRPSLHKIFNVNNKTGLSSIIIGEKTIKDCIFSTSIDNLDLMPAGPVPPNPSELIETKEMEQLFNELVKQYDYIILDTPPLALVSDSLSLSKFVHTTLYAIRQNYSHKDVINVANLMQQEDRLPNLVLVINDIKPSKSLGYSYYYGYSQGYNYGYYDYKYAKDYYDEKT